MIGALQKWKQAQQAGQANQAGQAGQDYYTTNIASPPQFNTGAQYAIPPQFNKAAMKAV